MAVAVPHPILDLVILAAALQVLDQRPLKCWQIVGVQRGLEVAEHRCDVFRLQAKQFLKLGVMDFVGLQVPVPQTQLHSPSTPAPDAPSLLLKRLVGGVQFQAALCDTVFQTDLGFAQFVFGTTALVDFLGQLVVELVAAFCACCKCSIRA